MLRSPKQHRYVPLRLLTVTRFGKGVEASLPLRLTSNPRTSAAPNRLSYTSTDSGRSGPRRFETVPAWQLTRLGWDSAFYDFRSQ